MGKGAGYSLYLWWKSVTTLVISVFFLLHVRGPLGYQDLLYVSGTLGQLLKAPDVVDMPSEARRK